MIDSIKNLIRVFRILLLRFKAKHCSTMSLASKIVIIAPHPDDEVIGCSGLIQQALLQGKQLYICVLTGGESSHKSCCHISEDELKKQRTALTKSINLKLGVSSDHLFLLNFPDGNIDKDHKEFHSLKTLIQQLNPDAIYIPHQKGEGWSDHVEAGNIIREITKGSSIALYEYCVWFWYYNVWSLDWGKGQILRMTPKEHQNKLQAIHDYITPLAPCGKPYSGILPKVFIWGNQWKNELYFKIR